MPKPRFLKNWFERHQHPVSLGLHYVGIPMTVLAVGCWIAGYFWYGLGLFALGYLLQFVGHAIEGNDAGEIILIKKALGKPYIAVAKRPGNGATAG